MIPGPETHFNENVADFESKLLETERPFRLPKYPNFFTPPEIIYYNQSLYHVNLTPVTNNPTHYAQVPDDEVKFLDIDEEWIDYVAVRYSSYIFVIENDNYLKLKDRIIDEGRPLAEKAAEESFKETAAGVSTAAPVEKPTPWEEPAQREQVTEAYDLDVPERTYHPSEHAFLVRLKELALHQGLFYDENDLYSFHVSAKTNLMTIIGGMSGTGKSRLAQLYGEALGLEHGQEMKMIPVSPSYQEPQDVLGYLNPATGVYHESETGLVRLLKAAEENPDQLYMVIFDEMNLSQVEHWFSPFISLLEVDPKDRYLNLFSDNRSIKYVYPDGGFNYVPIEKVFCVYPGDEQHDILFAMPSGYMLQFYPSTDHDHPQDITGKKELLEELEEWIGG